MKTSRMFHILLAVAFSFSLLGSLPRDAAAGFAADYDRSTPYVPGEIIVSFASQDPHLLSAQVSALADSVGAQVVRQYAGLSLLSVNEDADVFALAAKLSTSPGVAFAEPNYISWIPEDEALIASGEPTQISEISRVYADGSRHTFRVADLLAMRTERRAQFVPTYSNDGLNNWGWSAVNADIIWPNTAASPQICIVDTGVDIAHPDLTTRVTNGWDFVNFDNVPNDDNGHGTFVAGIMVARNNNGKGIAGVSNGTALAVKVLGAQGWGTSFDIASGIRYCADRPTIKIINLSLAGTSPSSTEYSALQYAINDRGKLIVTAAGNQGRTWNEAPPKAVAFPGSWASNMVCPDGTTMGIPCNNISTGILAVGASRGPGGTLWVDENGDSVHASNENFLAEQCATDFSNFGNWVQLAAPGENIHSTTPVSYPFWEGTYGEASASYDTWSGTSMSAAFVSGGAARAWSIYPAFTASEMKTHLINTGDPLTMASDGNILTLNQVYQGYYGSEYVGDAPFCWPNGSWDHGQFVNGWVNMSASRYLNVAAAMNRGAIEVTVTEATTNLPLKSTTIQALVGTVVKDTAVTGNFVTTHLINLPASTNYDLKINKTGFTAGAQKFGTVYVEAGKFNTDVTSIVSVGPSSRIHAVLNAQTSDLVLLYLWMPNLSSIGGVVGYANYLAFPPYSRSDTLGPGLLSDFPRARWYLNPGWPASYSYPNTQTITILPKPGAATSPYYVTGSMAAEGYDFIIRGDSVSFATSGRYVFRYWAAGVLKATVVGPSNCDLDGANDIPGDIDDEIFWEPGFVGWGNGSNFTIWNKCKAYDTISPYAVDENGISQTQAR
jgi:subtilisin family serine protease